MKPNLKPDMDPHMKNSINRGLTLALVSAGAASCSSQPATPPLERMNVIYILADDLGYGDLGCTGSTKILTPNIDRMRAEGMLFTQHYSGSTVSAPSRSALMTGLHTGHTPIRGNLEIEGEGQAPLPAGTWTLGRMFHEAGYVTGAFGKWGLGYPGSEGDPVYQGFDRFFGYNCQRQAHRYYPDHLWSNLDRVELEKNRDGACGTYAPDRIQQEALQFIRENRDRPFFLYLPVIQPHAELLAPDDEILRSYRGKFDERPYVNKGGDYRPGPVLSNYCSQAEPYATFAAMVTRIDRYVGEVFALLRELGLDRRTLVLFTSDNGPHREGGANPDYFDSYGPFRGVKRDLYEGGIRLPLIAWAPGRIAAESTNDHVCAFWDMLPTFAEVAGVELPDTLATDGISIVPALTGRGLQPEHDYLYWEFHEGGGKQAVRRGEWKAVRQNVQSNPEGPIELYDLSRDLHEDHNVAESHPALVREMDSLMRAARTESPLFRFGNPPLPIE